MRREFAILPAALIVVAAYGCSLNPQPLPPETVYPDAGEFGGSFDAGRTTGNPTVGDAGDIDINVDGGTKGGTGGEDAGEGAAPDATTEPPHSDGGTALDATNGSDGGGPATPPDGAVPDGGKADATPIDGSVDSASALEAATDAGVDAAL